MSDANGPSMAPSPDQDRIAKAQFAKAQQVVSTGNYDYGIKLLLSCCKLDPANLIYRQALRRTEKTKYNNNMRGSAMGKLTTLPVRARIKASMAARDYQGAIQYAESLLKSN